MAKKQTTMKTKRLFLGVDSGGRGTEMTASADELNVLDGVTAGTVTASKGLVVDSSSALDALTVTALTAPTVTGNASGLKSGSVVTPVQAAGTLTLDTQPTAGDTMTIGNRTYTFTTDETANAAGEIDVGADLADCKTLITAAIDGDETWETAHTQVTDAAWDGDDLVLTAITAGVAGNSIATTETFTAETNVFDAATLGTTTAGVDGTVGAKGAVLWDTTNLHISANASTVSNNNWDLVIPTDITAAEFDVIDGVTAGTVTASKALVVNAASGIDAVTVATLTGNVVGNVTGNVTGNSSGILSGSIVTPVKAAGTLTSTGALVPGSHAESVVTFADNPSEDETITINATVYRFKATTAAAYDINIGVSAAESLDFLKLAINATGTGDGSDYHTGTAAHPDVYATTNTDTTQKVVARTPGTTPNTLATTETGANISWADTTLGGGTGDSVAGVTTAGATFTINTRTYTIVTALSETSGATAIVDQVLYGGNEATCLDNIKVAINNGATEGTNYSTGTTVNTDVTADANTDTTQVFTAKTAGTAGNSIATTETLANTAFDAATLGTTTAGVDGTVGAKGAVYWNSTNLHIAANASTVSNNNWDIVIPTDITADEFDVIDGVTAGTGAASKAMVLDSSSDITMPGIITFAKPQEYDHNTTITAFATGGQGSATALTGEFNNVTTCATDGDSVALPTAVAGMSITVKNSGAASCAVFPATSDSINAMAANLSVNIAPGGQLTFRAISDTVWETNEVVVMPSPSTQKGELIIKATDNDGDTVTTITNDAMGQASTIAIPDPGAATAEFVLTNADNDGSLVTATAVELNYLDGSSSNNTTASKAAMLDASKYLRTNALCGTAGTNCTVVEYGDGYHHMSQILFSGDTALGNIPGDADLALGYTAYTMPGYPTLIHGAAISISLTQTQGNITNDTPKIGVGTVLANGVVAVLNGTATFMDIITEQTMDDCNGTAEIKMLTPTANNGVPLMLPDSQVIYLNFADGWDAAAGGDTAAQIGGTLWIEWSIFPV